MCVLTMSSCVDRNMTVDTVDTDKLALESTVYMSVYIPSSADYTMYLKDNTLYVSHNFRRNEIEKKKLTSEQMEKINGYLSALDEVCEEEVEIFHSGPGITLAYNGNIYDYLYGNCVNENFDDLVTLLFQYSPIDIVDWHGYAILPHSPVEEIY